jgi:hypothetical protein
MLTQDRTANILRRQIDLYLTYHGDELAKRAGTSPSIASLQAGESSRIDMTS